MRSAPPPNQGFVVTTKRVFMCTVGTCGFQGCAITEMPAAQKRGSSAEPGIWPRNSGANSPCTVETWTPTFSNTRPRISAMTPPPPAAPPWSVRDQGFAREAAGARRVRIERPRGLVLEPLERRADAVAQRREPGRRVALQAVDGLGLGHG